MQRGTQIFLSAQVTGNISRGKMTISTYPAKKATETNLSVDGCTVN